MPVESKAGELILEWIKLTGSRQDVLASEYGFKNVTFHQVLHGKRSGQKYSVQLTKIMSDKGITIASLDELRKLKEA